jgi:hypothetical protein
MKISPAESTKRNRRVVRLEDFSEEEMILIAQATAAPADSRLDTELEYWKPQSIERGETPL